MISLLAIDLDLIKASPARWSCLWLLLSAVATISCVPATQTQQAQSGHLDLSDATRALEDGTLKLDGSWLFRWQEFVDPGEFSHGAPTGMFEITVPSIWNGEFSNRDNEGLSGRGFATYALELKLPPPPSGSSWSVLIEEVSTAYSLFAVTKDGVFPLSTNGRIGAVDSEHIPQWVPTLSMLPTPDDGQVWLVLHVSNFSYARGGAWKSFMIGTQSRLERALVVRYLFSAGLLGILLVMALYHLARFLMRRSDLGSAWFTLLCVLVAVREFTISRMIVFLPHIPTDATFTWLMRCEFLSFQMTGPAVMSFVGIVFPSRRYASLTRLGWLVATPYFLICLFGSTQAISMVLKSYYPIIGLQIITTVVYLGYCVLRGRVFAWVALFGCVVLGIGAVHDMFYAHGYSGGGFWTTYCFGIFVLVESYLLAAQSTTAFKQVDKSRRANLEKIKAQIESSRLEKQLSGALKTKIHIFSNVAHELNNPLNYVSLGADGSQLHTEELKKVLDGLFDGAGSSPEGNKVIEEIDSRFAEIQKNIDIICSGSQAAASVVTEMRGLAEVDGTIREALVVGGLLEGAMRRVRADQQPDVFARVHFEESLGDLSQTVEGNPYMLIHAISHVLINAVRYCVESAEQPTVWLATKVTPTAWVLSVQNNGPSITPAAIQLLLEPGAMGESSRNLPVAHALLKEQGACLRLCDTGQITGRVIFEIELPLLGQGPTVAALAPRVQ